MGLLQKKLNRWVQDEAVILGNLLSLEHYWKLKLTKCLFEKSLLYNNSRDRSSIKTVEVMFFSVIADFLLMPEFLLHAKQ